MNKNEIQDIRKFKKQEMEHLEDIIEILEVKKAIHEPVWPNQLKALKEAFEAHDSYDWEKCRAALKVFLEYEDNDSSWWMGYRAPVYWNYQHFMKWIAMLCATELSEEPEDSPARVFYLRLVEHQEEQIYQKQNRVS